MSQNPLETVDYVKNFSSQQTPKLDACFEMLSVSHVFYWINWKMCLKLLDLVGKKPHSLLLNSTDSLFFFFYIYVIRQLKEQFLHKYFRNFDNYLKVGNEMLILTVGLFSYS